MASGDGGLGLGISWRSGEAALRLIAADGGDVRRQPLVLGSTVGWQVRGDRHCTGVWLPDIGERRPCPDERTIPAATATSQCPGCGSADPGRALARNFAIDDPRPFAVYLAWFGDGLVKVGLTAVARDHDRLVEQGALAFTWLAEGPFTSARRLEQAAATTGSTQERLPRSRKLAAWWLHPAPDTSGTSHDELAAVHGALAADLDWPDDLQPQPFALRDLTAVFGLDGPPPTPVREVTALADGAVLSGRLRILAGHDAIVDTADGPLLVDLRLLAGWDLSPTDAPPSGLATTPFDPGDGPAPAQESLF
jgi:uncharacterized protein DUF2797